MTIQELREWFDKYKADIPKKQVRKRTIMDIMGCAHLENHWSELYKFFLDEDETHGLKDLFIRSLENVYNNLGGLCFDGKLKNFRIFREDPTTDGQRSGRIDLLLLGEEKRAIIIENKVYHNLNNNPLSQYIETVKRKGYDDEKRIAKVVLALHKNYKDQKRAEAFNYKYILHIDLINEVRRNLSSYICQANHLYIPLLLDFIQNIINETNMTATPEEMLFFSEQYASINEIYNLYDKVIKEYKTQLKNLSFDKELKLTPTYKSFNINDENRQLMYLQYTDKRIYLTLFLNFLWDKHPRVRVILEVQDDKIKGHYKNKRDEWEVKLHDDKDVTLSAKHDWKNGHIAWCDIEVPINDNQRYADPKDVAGIIKDTINNNFRLYQLAVEIENY